MGERRRTWRKAIRILAAVLLFTVAAGVVLGITYRSFSLRFVPGDAHALDGIVRSPVAESLGTLQLCLLPRYPWLACRDGDRECRCCETGRILSHRDLWL